MVPASLFYKGAESTSTLKEMGMAHVSLVFVYIYICVEVCPPPLRNAHCYVHLTSKWDCGHPHLHLHTHGDGHLHLEAGGSPFPFSCACTYVYIHGDMHIYIYVCVCARRLRMVPISAFHGDEDGHLHLRIYGDGHHSLQKDGGGHPY
jgi:hypothetical protein